MVHTATVACQSVRRRGDGGQATAELALSLPFVVVLLLSVVQVGMVVRTQVLVTHAAREAVRAAAVSPEPIDVPRAVGTSGLASDRLEVDVDHPQHDQVTVSVRYRTPTDVPLVGAVLPDVTLGASATMRIEYQR